MVMVMNATGSASCRHILGQSCCSLACQVGLATLLPASAVPGYPERYHNNEMRTTQANRNAAALHHKLGQAQRQQAVERDSLLPGLEAADMRPGLHGSHCKGQDDHPRCTQPPVSTLRRPKLVLDMRAARHERGGSAVTSQPCQVLCARSES